ncbi:TetR/AcrR family transcriptional regulator [Actinotalea sp. M2MS4P-6]|uniref:TetR/AcrR family transcriptional regulator n=1 Tax=Actinotalea sp. M2MS4P-6 TaxID=2983762 RepID=UPI0021E504D6|nr:TetR/AcrR family transcriptional regulator [Actinotalea sp. M2MS4P-6]
MAHVDPRVARSRAAVLAAATELLAERGVAGTTIEAVAARSGVAKTTIYRQWPDQHALVLDAFDTVLPVTPAPDTGALRGDLLAIVSGLARALVSSPAATLMPALIDAAERDPGFADLHHREAARRHEAVREVVQRARDRGEVGDDVDLDDLLDALAGPLFHRRYVTGRPLDDRTAERVVDRVVAGLMRPTGHPAT